MVHFATEYVVIKKNFFLKTAHNFSTNLVLKKKDLFLHTKLLMNYTSHMNATDVNMA